MKCRFNFNEKWFDLTFFNYQLPSVFWSITKKLRSDEFTFETPIIPQEGMVVFVDEFLNDKLHLFSEEERNFLLKYPFDTQMIEGITIHRDYVTLDFV